MVHEHRGEREMQVRMQSQPRAERFYQRQMKNRLLQPMVDLIQRQEMVFVATADADGNCDCSPRFGSAGFVLVVNDTTLAYPEYRGNGVYASLGNMLENPHAGLVFLDMFESTVGLHVNGRTSVHQPGELPVELAEYVEHHLVPLDTAVECWVVLRVDEAYIHCSKHVPLLQRREKPINWGTDDPRAKGEDFFRQPDCGNGSSTE